MKPTAEAGVNVRFDEAELRDTISIVVYIRLKTNRIISRRTNFETLSNWTIEADDFLVTFTIYIDGALAKAGGESWLK